MHKSLRLAFPLLIVSGVGILVASGILLSSLLNYALDWDFLDEDPQDSLKSGQEPTAASDSIEKKLSEIWIGPIKAKNATLDELIEFLRIRTLEEESKPTIRGGVGFVLRKPRIVEEARDGLGLENAPKASGDSPKLTLQSEGGNLVRALDLICEAADYQWKIDRQLLKIVIYQDRAELPPGRNPTEPDESFPGGDF